MFWGKAPVNHIVDFCYNLMRRGFVPEPILNYLPLKEKPVVCKPFKNQRNYVKTLKQHCLNSIINDNILVPNYYPKTLLNQNSNEREFNILK